MSFRSWLKSWLLADPEQDTLYAAIDQELMRQESWRLDVRDGRINTPCWAQDPTGWICGLHTDHNGDHMAWTGNHEVMAVWPRQEATHDT